MFIVTFVYRTTLYWEMLHTWSPETRNRWTRQSVLSTFPTESSTIHPRSKKSKSTLLSRLLMFNVMSDCDFICLTLLYSKHVSYRANQFVYISEIRIPGVCPSFDVYFFFIFFFFFFFFNDLFIYFRPVVEEPMLTETVIEDRPLTFTVVEKGSQRGRQLLVDSNGYSYGVKVFPFYIYNTFHRMLYTEETCDRVTHNEIRS